MNYYLGVDIGTTSVKGLAMTIDGKVLGSLPFTIETVNPQPGFSEQDPEHIFQAVLQVIFELNRQWGSTHTLEGISFSSAMHSLLAVDQEGLPLTPMITWADSRSRDIAETIKSDKIGRLIYRNCGTPVHPMLPLCKIIWIKQNQPAVFQKTFKFISIKEWIFFRLFETYLVDHSIASATGLFDIRMLAWCPEALTLAGIGEEKLSSLVPTTFFLKGLKKGWASQMGIPAETTFIIGASDGCLANLGSRVGYPGQAAFTIGTSGAVRITSPVPVQDPEESIFNYLLVEKIYVCGGAVNNGGNVLQWYLENFLGPPGGKVVTDDQFMELAFSVPAGSGGLIFLPYIQGERSPFWDSRARGAFFGIQLAHTQAHFMRAVLEGILFGLFQVVSLLEKNSRPISTLYVSGGFTRSSRWVQMLADISGKKVILSGAEDASALGSIYLGMFSTGRNKELMGGMPLASLSGEFNPENQNNMLYHQIYSVFTGLYPSLKTAFHTLGDIHQKI